MIWCVWYLWLEGYDDGDDNGADEEGDDNENEATWAKGFACTVHANTAPLLFPPRLSMTTRGLSEDEEHDDDEGEEDHCDGCAFSRFGFGLFIGQ